MDPYLVALISAAEAGEPCPPLWFTLTSGDQVVGTPTKPGEFVDGSSAPLHERYGRRGFLNRQSSETDALADAHLAPLSRADAARADSGYVTLENARVRWGGRADGADFPVLRLALGTVALWWIAGGQEVKASGAFFVGAAIPIGGG
jgi:hypothetical protein